MVGAIDAPIIVTKRGRIFSSGSVMILGSSKHLEDKINPIIIVPVDSRIKGLYNFGFSSFIGFIGAFFGVFKKQKDIMRNL